MIQGIQQGKGDVCLVLDKDGGRIAELAVQEFFDTGVDNTLTYTVSLVCFHRQTGESEDLLGQKQGAITGRLVTNASEAKHTLHLDTIHLDTRDMIATVTVRPQLGRLHVVFSHSAGLWTHAAGLPARLLEVCQVNVPSY
jgi:hypothetical protein